MNRSIVILISPFLVTLVLAAFLHAQAVNRAEGGPPHLSAEDTKNATVVTKRFRDLYKKDPSEASSFLDSLEPKVRADLANGLIAESNPNMVYLGATILIASGNTTNAIPALANLIASRNFSSGLQGYALTDSQSKQAGRELNDYLFRNIQKYAGKERENVAVFLKWWDLGTPENVSLARQLLNDGNAHIAYGAATILIRNNFIDEALPTLAFLIVSGKNVSELRGRLGREWSESKGTNFADYVFLRIARYTIARFAEYKGEYRENATGFLKSKRLFENGQPVSSEEVARMVVEKEQQLKRLQNH